MAKLATAKKDAATDLRDATFVIAANDAAAADQNSGATSKAFPYKNDCIKGGIADGLVLDDRLPLAETDSGINSDQEGSQGPWLELDSEIADLEEGLVEVAGEVRTLLAEMDDERDSSRQAKERFENQMASAAAKLIPMLIKVRAMPLEQRKAFLVKPATAMGVEKKWPDRRAVDPDAVMVTHKYLFDHLKVRKGNVMALCHRIGYTAAALVRANITKYEEAYDYIMDHGRPSKISQQYTAEMKNKYDVGLSVLDSKEAKFIVEMPEDNACPAGSYRALLFRKIEAIDGGAVYGFVDDLAPGEGDIRRIIERYQSRIEYADKKNKDHSDEADEK